VPGWVGGVVPLVKVTLDVGWEDAVQGDDLVAERAGGVGDGVGAAEEVEDAHWVGLGEQSGGCQPRRVRGRSRRAWRYGR
jgi:hypothetical protein